ncbi:MAG: hypothetical protein M3461_01345 [Pseudomonadota bacterium]|nr:hypothetical protein [Pseudomonadota bacterium]
MRRFAERYGKPLETVSPALMAALEAQDWPGNVRELEHVIERAGAERPSKRPWACRSRRATRSRRAWQRPNALLRVLEATRWRVAGPNGAAERLWLRPTTLESRRKKLGIRRPG